MAEILTRTGLRSLVDTNLPSGTGAISAEDHRDVEDSLIDSFATIFEAEIRVINMTTTTPPGGASDRDAYVVAAGATGAWADKDGEIAVWDDDKTGGGGWQFSGTPKDGQAVWNLDDDTQYRWDAGVSPAAWGEVETGGGSTSYDVPVVFGGTPTAGEVIGRYTMVRIIDFAANFSGSQGTVETAPDATFDIDVRIKDSTVSPSTDTSIGTVSVSTAGTYTFTTTGGTTKQITAGQKLEFIAPSNSPAEASIDGISFMLKGTEG